MVEPSEPAIDTPGPPTLPIDADGKANEYDNEPARLSLEPQNEGHGNVITIREDGTNVDAREGMIKLAAGARSSRTSRHSPYGNHPIPEVLRIRGHGGSYLPTYLST